MEIPSSLHEEVVSFAAEMAPSPEEQEHCEKVIEILRKLTYDVFGNDVELSAFGSYANGLATKYSDLDLVVTGLLKPDTPGGFFGFKKHLVGERLALLESSILECPVVRVKKVELIRHAKFPVLKILMEKGFMIDITINDETTTRAAHFVLSKVRQYPSLRPLCLVLKALLKANNLDTVKDGGLGGFSLVNMAIAHIQEKSKSGDPTHDYGELLLSFLCRYGYHFNGESQAVSVLKGGIVPKHFVYRYSERTHSRRRAHLHSSAQSLSWFVQNPVTGLDVAYGSYNLHLVRDLFRTAHFNLNQIQEQNEKKEHILDRLFMN